MPEFVGQTNDDGRDNWEENPRGEQAPDADHPSTLNGKKQHGKGADSPVQIYLSQLQTPMRWEEQLPLLEQLPQRVLCDLIRTLPIVS